MFKKINTIELIQLHFLLVITLSCTMARSLMHATQRPLDFLKIQMLLQHYIISEFNKIKSIISVGLEKPWDGKRRKKKES